MSARCIRCGGEPLEQCLFCERCYSVVAVMATDGPTDRFSPWVKMAREKRLPAKDLTNHKGLVL